jgi:hypothetical protein
MENVNLRERRVSETSSLKRHAILWFATLLTLVFIACVFWAGWSAKPPENCVGTFACLTANEWGDFFAGVSAPVAFIWLITAVFIQSKELAEQRRELALTRQEFELNREVLNGQAESLRVQTDVLMQDRATHEFLERIRFLRFWIESTFTDMRDVHEGYTDSGDLIIARRDTGYLTANMPSEPLVYFSALLMAIGTSLEKSKMEECVETRWLNYSSPVDLDTLGKKLKQITTMRDRVGPSAVAVLLDADADYVLANYPRISAEQIATWLQKDTADF